MNDRAVFESSPRVLSRQESSSARPCQPCRHKAKAGGEGGAKTHALSQASIDARLASTSAMLTRFFSPPLTPRTYASPTGVSSVCSSPNTLSRRALAWAL